MGDRLLRGALRGHRAGATRRPQPPRLRGQDRAPHPRQAGAGLDPDGTFGTGIEPAAGPDRVAPGSRPERHTTAYAAPRRERPGGGGLHLWHHRRAEGGDADARQPGRQRHRSQGRLPLPAGRATPLDPAPLAHVRADLRADGSVPSRGLDRLPRQSSAGGADPDLPRVPGDDAADRAGRPEAARLGHPAQGGRLRQARHLRAASPHRASPAALREAAPLSSGDRAIRRALPTLAIGAAALEEDLAQRWTDMGVDVLQGYGATELSPAVAFTRPSRNRSGTVGEAVPGVEIRIAEDGEIQSAARTSSLATGRIAMRPGRSSMARASTTPGTSASWTKTDS